METPDWCKETARIPVISLAVRNIQTSTDCAVHHGKRAAAETQRGSTLGKGRISTGTLFLSNFGKLHGWTSNRPTD
jgi:hypothetical protein